MSHLLLALVMVLVQDTPTPGTRPADPPKRKPHEIKGTSGSIGLGTGEGSDVGESKGESAALGLRTHQNVAGTEYGEAHAIAELAPASPVATGDDPHGTRPQEKSPKLKSRLVYGFCAITHDSLLSSTGKYLRAELYLYRPDTKKEASTREEKTPVEEYYHAIVENGRIVGEQGDRALFKEFAGLGAEAWMNPFEETDLKDKSPIDLEKVVKGILSRVVEDLSRGVNGKADPKFKDRTRIERDATVKGASGRGEAGN